MLPFSRIKLYFLKEFNKWDLIKLFINTFITNAKRLPDSLGTLILLPNNRKSEVKSQGYKDSTFLLSSPNFFYNDRQLHFKEIHFWNIYFVKYSCYQWTHYYKVCFQMPVFLQNYASNWYKEAVYLKIK